MTPDEVILQDIGRLRRGILVHSYIYYRMNRNIIDDSEWSRRAFELDRLQRLYPDLAAQAPLYEEFKHFDPSTGSDLPMDSEWVSIVANRLLYLENKDFGKE